MAAGFVYTRRVVFYETDLAGVVHFSNYFRYMEEAEHAMWRAAGMRIDASTGLIQWTPNSSQLGPQTVVLQASDSLGGLAVQSFEVTVQPQLPAVPPAFGAPPALLATEGQLYTYTPAVRASSGDAANGFQPSP